MKPQLKSLGFLLLVTIYGMLFGTLFFAIGDWALVGIACGIFWIAGGVYAILHSRNVDWTFIKKAAIWGIVFYGVEMILLGYLGVV